MRKDLFLTSKKTFSLNGEKKQAYFVESIFDLCQNLIYGEVVKIMNGSCYIELSGEYFWLSKEFTSINPNIKIGYDVEVLLITDSAAHRVYVNSAFSEIDVYYKDFPLNKI